MQASSLYEQAIEIAKTVTISCKTPKEAEQLLELVNELTKHRWAIRKQQS